MGLHRHSPEKLQEIVLPLRGLGLGSLTFQSLQFQNNGIYLEEEISCARGRPPPSSGTLSPEITRL